MSTYVFIDSRVRNYESLLASLAPDAQVVILDPAQDGIEQIAAALEGTTDLDAIHIISHGDDGTLYLGDSVLSSDNLHEYTSALANIGAALGTTGDILLYGCEVGNGVTGQTFIENLALHTGADVAASTDTTGSAALGGDWVLESSTGTIETQAITSTTFAGLLAPAIDLTTIAAGTGGFVIYGQDADDQSGFSVASAGDINGDGFDDLIIGARLAACRT